MERSGDQCRRHMRKLRNNGGRLRLLKSMVEEGAHELLQGSRLKLSSLTSEVRGGRGREEEGD
eukprot:760959-Hanusia_phi.AAC.2